MISLYISFSINVLFLSTGNAVGTFTYNIKQLPRNIMFTQLFLNMAKKIMIHQKRIPR